MAELLNDTGFCQILENIVNVYWSIIDIIVQYSNLCQVKSPNKLKCCHDDLILIFK
jgi:hypothetical protein